MVHGVECMDVEAWGVMVFLCGVSRRGPVLRSFLIVVTIKKQLKGRRALF